MVFKIILSFFLLAVGLGLPVFADVRDGAKFFSDSTVNAMNQKIDDVKRKTGKELILETVESTEGIKPGDYSLNRAKALNVNGIYVLIAKQERKVEIQVGNKTHKVFNNSVTSTFKSKFTSAFKSGDYDSGLENAVGYYSDVLLSFQENANNKNNYAGHGKTNSSQNEGTSWLGIIFFVLIIFLIFRVVSSLFGRGGGYSPGYGGMGGGGMGFFGTLMTGIFGAMAGNWLYDKFMGPGSGGLYGSDHSDSSDFSSNDDSYFSDSGSFDSSDSSDSGGDW